MSLSIGWFEPKAFYQGVEYFTRHLRRAMPVVDRTWPLRVSSIRMNGKGTGVAYAIVDGHIPMHIDQTGIDDSDGRIFQFVLETSNRPMLLSTPARIANRDIMFGNAKGYQNAFVMQALELKPGIAVHFDITEYWHGIGGLPVFGKSVGIDVSPSAVIVQVAGFAANQIGDALEKAVELVRRDRPFWDVPSKKPGTLPGLPGDEG